MFYTHKGSSDRKSTYLYENLPVNTKMEFLSRKLILLAILLHGQFIHHTQISLYPNTQFFIASGIFELLPGLIPLHSSGMLGKF